MNTNSEQFSEFLDGFAESANLNRHNGEAKEAWYNFSHLMTDSEREEVEQGGFMAGKLEGQLFRETYPEVID